jgi:transcriptional regulator with PAS, ATPase and Fis domain
VFPIEIEPLRARREDIVLLGQHFLNRFSEEMQSSIRALSPAAVRVLERHTWPGNVRELRQVIERALILAGDHLEIQPEHLVWDADLSLPERNLRTTA